MSRPRRRVVPRLLLIIAAPALLGSAFNIVGSSAAQAPVIRVLSNRADLISGGDALIEVVPSQQMAASMGKPTRSLSALLDVRLNGLDVTRVFDVVDGMVAGTTAPRVLGVVKGLKVGKNVLTVSTPTGAARLDITNHPISGPVFAGKQVTPWICSTEDHELGEPLDSKCSGKTRYEFLYKSTNPLVSGLQPYDPDDPPADVATTTTDQGVTVPFIVRNERGTIDRGIYDIAVLYDPAKPWTPTQPQRGWNGKVVYPFGGSCGPFHVQTANSGAVLDEDALADGFAVATSGLNVLGNNCNEAVSAESLMMVKEHLAETYGPIRYTIGNGCSGGSIQQINIASAYPGLLDGILPSCTFTDVATTAIEVLECRLLLHYFNEVSPHLWANPQQRALVSGHMSASLCHTWINVYSFDRLGGDPTYGCTLPVLSAFNLPYAGVVERPDAQEPEWVYHPQTNPKGTRCTVQDYSVATFGGRPSDGYARRPGDNIGVQYGLQALASGLITAEQFVDLNSKLGGLDIDLSYTPKRLPEDEGASALTYRAGRVSDGRALASTPIIDLRGHNNNEIHADFYSYALRERVLKANGSLGNYAMFISPAPLVPLPQVNDEAFRLMDEWLAAIEKDTTLRPRAVKVAAHRPAGAVDSCWVGVNKVTDWTLCQTLFPHFTSPRVAAGGPVSNDVLKCQTKPLRREDYSVSFTDTQWSRLETVFPTGVCDWSKAGIGQQPPNTWATFQHGPGGRSLGAAPRSAAISGGAQPAVLSGGTRRGAPAHLPATGVGWAGSATLGASGLLLALALRRMLRRI